MGNKQFLKSWLRREELVSSILRMSSGLNSKQTRISLEEGTGKGGHKRQWDIVWMGLLECLPTRNFLKSRHLTATEQCPRSECGGGEKL